MFSCTVPQCQQAIQQEVDGKLSVVKEASIPSFLPGHVLVKTIAVALNPSDNKIIQHFPLTGARVGTDFVGYVVQAADDVPSETLPLGTMVSGATFCFAPEHRLANGAFAEYVRARADLLTRVPLPSTNSDDAVHTEVLQASTLGTAVATCILALWSTDALNLEGTPDSPLSSNTSLPVLVYGGSTATGTMAIQLLRLSGYTPIAVCSPHNFELVKSRGASIALDHASTTLIDDIKTHTDKKLKYVLDCVSTEASATSCYDAIQRPGGRYASLEHISDAILSKRQAVIANFVFAAEVFGEDIKLGNSVYDRKGDQDKLKFARQYTAMVQRLLDAKKLTSHPIELLDNGLEGVIEGLEEVAAGKVSGKKLVAIVSPTD